MRKEDPIHVCDPTALPGIEYARRYATNVLHDVFGGDGSLPLISVVRRLPQPAPPASAHYHRGWDETIIMQRGRVAAWVGPTASALTRYDCVPGSMLFIPAGNLHVFVNNASGAEWAIVMNPRPDAPPARSRREVSETLTVDAALSPEMVTRVAASFEDLGRAP